MFLVLPCRTLQEVAGAAASRHGDNGCGDPRSG
jgi:hypothetical protein